MENDDAIVISSDLEDTIAISDGDESDTTVIVSSKRVSVFQCNRN